MFNSILSSLVTWNNKCGDRQKLQHAYLLLTVTIVFLAGIVSLLNAKKGHAIVVFALFLAGVFITNAVVWNLMQAGLLYKLPKQNRKNTR